MIYADAIEEVNGSSREYYALVSDTETQEVLYEGKTKHDNAQDAIDEAKAWAAENA